jgi:hypothetical protein
MLTMCDLSDAKWARNSDAEIARKTLRNALRRVARAQRKKKRGRTFGIARDMGGMSRRDTLRTTQTGDQIVGRKGGLCQVMVHMCARIPSRQMGHLAGTPSNAGKWARGSVHAESEDRPIGQRVCRAQTESDEERETGDSPSASQGIGSSVSKS